MRAFLELPGIRFIREMVDLYFEKHVSRAAAELAYFLILSFFPLLICVNAFIGLLDLNVGAI
ncbi:MAG TPA: YihY/virulence factor BrkB family protein, partial [Candidatus Flavonifractor merdipullorum]|nr:YihY/virulence factor BrkB family protein [Candidatus Flavonifractor merdipullorum]